MGLWTGRSGRRSNNAAGGRVTARDLEILRFLGRLRFATAPQIGRAFSMSPRMVYRRCHGMCALGLLRYERVLHGLPGVYLTTPAGLGLCGCALPPARVDLLNYRHDLAVVSLSLDLLAASPGAVWQSERELRHELGGQAGIGVRAHLPDGVLTPPGGPRTAVELELTPKTSKRLAGILRFYARSRDYAAVRYFLPTEAAVARLGRMAAAQPHIRAERWTVPPEAGARE